MEQPKDENPIEIIVGKNGRMLLDDWTQFNPTLRLELLLMEDTGFSYKSFTGLGAKPEQILLLSSLVKKHKEARYIGDDAAMKKASASADALINKICHEVADEELQEYERKNNSNSASKRLQP